MSSPMDTMVGIKKKRFAALQKNKKTKEAQKEQKPMGGFNIGIEEADIGASPQMSKGSIYTKGNGGGGKMSPLH